MRRLFLPLMLCLFVPAYGSRADVLSTDAKLPQSMPASITLQPIKISKKFSELKDMKLYTNPHIPAKSVYKANGKIINDLYAQQAATEKEEGFRASDKKYSRSKYGGFLSQVSPEYSLNNNFLSLVKVSTPRRKQAFMFVFFMNPKGHARTLKEKIAKHTHMHILWTGPKQLVSEQKIVRDYPVNFSIANHKDGYSQGEWNLVLPSKKPKEVAVSFLWSF
jgi:hypothetical protein